MIPLQLNEVTKQYGEKTAVNGISLVVKAGEIYGLLGANGAGKTTTMRMTLGLIAPDGGHIRWKGNGYTADLRRLMGYLPEERGLYPKIKVGEQLMYLAELRGVSRRKAETELRRWLERFGISEYENKRVEELSKGNQQKIQFIAAVIHDPDILILDEAFSGLDPVNVELLKDTVISLRDEGKAILFSSHRMEHVEELCENICMLNRGKTVLQGTLKDIKRSFPKETVLLETELEVAGLDRIPGVTAVKRRSTGYELHIAHQDAAQDILRHAQDQTSIYRFQVMEPTLHEIFIRKVGGANE